MSHHSGSSGYSGKGHFQNAGSPETILTISGCPEISDRQSAKGGVAKGGTRAPKRVKKTNCIQKQKRKTTHCIQFVTFLLTSCIHNVNQQPDFIQKMMGCKKVLFSVVTASFGAPPSVAPPSVDY